MIIAEIGIIGSFRSSGPVFRPFYHVGRWTLDLFTLQPIAYSRSPAFTCSLQPALPCSYENTAQAV